MSTLKALLYMLSVFSLITAHNVFVFNHRQRKFRISRPHFYAVRIVHKIVLLPVTITLAILVFAVILSVLLILIHPQCPVCVFFGAYCFCGAFLIHAMLGPSLYVGYIIERRMQHLLELLNDFVRCYDEYEDLFAKPAEINWGLLTVLIIKTLLHNPLAYIVSVATENKAHFFAIYMLSMPSIIVSTVAAFALIMLHTFYKAPYEDAALRNGKRLYKLLTFYERIRRLRYNLAQHFKIFALMDICMSLESITLCVVYILTGTVEKYLVIIVSTGLSHVVLFTHITNAMYAAECQIGIELLQSNAGLTLRTDRILQLFFLDRLCIERLLEKDIKNVLHMRKPIVLNIIEYSITFAIYLITYDVMLHLQLIHRGNTENINKI